MRNLARDEHIGPRIVPIIPDEARTFGMDALFREFKIYASQGQKYEPVDYNLMLSYTEAADGQLLEEGITEAGATASWIAAGTSYATRGVPMVPFYIFYSMFGFQRVGDLLWQAADSRTRGFLLGATAGRTTLLGEGLQHQDGHSLVLATTNPGCQAYDPAFAYELAAIVKHGIRRMYGPSTAGVDPDVFYYLTLYNENYPMPPIPDRPGIEDEIVQGLYRWQEAPEGPSKRATIIFSGSAQGAARQAAAELAEHYDVGVELWSATSYKALRDEALAVERWNRLHPGQSARTPLVTRLLADAAGPGRRRHRLHEAGARAGRPLRARPAVRAPRHRRLRPLRHPRGAAAVLRGRRPARRGGRPPRAGRAGRGEDRGGDRRHQPLRHRARRAQPRRRVGDRLPSQHRSRREGSDGTARHGARGSPRSKASWRP